MDHRSEPRQELEIMQLLVAMSCGDATEDQYAQLDELVRNHPSARKFVVTGLTHLADFEWENGMPTPVSVAADDALAAPASRSNVPCSVGVSRRTPSPQKILPWWAGICASFILGATTAFWFMHQRNSEFNAPSAPKTPPYSGKVGIPVATLVSNTSHMWDAREGVAMEAGALLQAGQSVALLDGVAEVQFETGVTARIQGPAILSIGASGIPELKYGKFIASNVNNEQFQVDIPIATAFVSKGSLIGVDAFGKEVVVHALKGNAVIAPFDRGAEEVSILPGEVVRLLTNARSQLGVYKAAASPEAFDFDIPLATDQITVTRQYADAVRQSEPLAYWRFEKIDSNVVRNEMRDRYNLHLLGDKVQIVHHEGNGHAEFIVRESPACFTSNETLDELAGQDYAVEFWMKPSHFHRGAIVSLVERASDDAGSIERHGLIVELESASPILRSAEGHPKTIRFLHRSPPHETLMGTSCNSPGPYRTEAWQHVAAVKNGGVMRLFVDGELAASENDETDLPPNLSLVVGQLFSFGTVRPFVGHLDELAIYSRALTSEEIQRRVRLVRATLPESN